MPADPQDPADVAARLAPDVLRDVYEQAAALYDAIAEGRFGEAQTHMGALGTALTTLRGGSAQSVIDAQDALEAYLKAPGGLPPKQVAERHWKPR